MLGKNREFFNEIKTLKLEELEYTNIFMEPERKKVQNTFATYNKNPNNPIIIDYGSHCTKAGWGSSENPCLVFKSVVSKNKDLKNADGIVYVGNKLKDFDYTKNNYKSPFERNVIQHFGLLENLNDYIFSELLINDSKINHPIIATECFANPDFCRSKLLEQLFECYQVPSVVLGVDALFSYQYNNNSLKEPPSECLIISMGNMTTHIVPIVGGEVQMKDIKRINVGGYHSFDLLYKHLNLKYPAFKSKLSQNYVQAIMENLTFVANDYRDQLNYFRYGREYFQNQNYSNKILYENNKIINMTLHQEVFEPVYLEFPFNFEPQTSTEDLKKKQELRREQAQRLRETMARRRQEKEQAHLEEIKELEAAEAEMDKDESKVDEILKRLDFESRDELKKRIIKLKLKLGLISKQALEEDKFTLINIPDDQLTPEQQKQKRYQLMQKQAAITRKLKKELESKKKEEEEKLKEELPEVYIADLYEKRRKLLLKIEEKKRQKTEYSGRNSRGSQKRLQAYVQLGELQKDKKGNVIDTFGMNDEDWAIYKKVSKDPNFDDDEEGYYAKLAEIDKELQKLDPNFEEMTKGPEEEIPELFPQFTNKVELNVDMIRGPEVFFQPTLVGVDQMGLAETIDLLLKNCNYSEDVKKGLLKNIFLTGGASFTKNIVERLTRELRALTPVGTEISIRIAKDPIFDTWRGMQTFGKKKENITKYGISKAEYEEYGSTYFKRNPFSNVYNL